MSNTTAPVAASVPPQGECVLLQKFEEARKRFGDLLTNPKTFLLGAGCSKSAGLPLTSELAARILDGGENAKLPQPTISLLQKIRDNYEGGNIEDYLSEMTDHLAIAERKERQGAGSDINIYGEDYSTDNLRAAVKTIKDAIARIIQHGVWRANIADYRRFAREIHYGLTAGKPRSSRTDYLCLNYDTLLEQALALEKISFADGMEGGEIGWWSPETYKRDDISARVFKLHGSINWRALDGDHDQLPRRIGAGVNLPDGGKEFMIWPASTKYRETQRDPYAQVAKLGWDEVIGGKNLTDRVLIIYGYRFADEHVNNEIEMCIRKSDGRLTVVAFVGDDEPKDKIKDWLVDDAISSQILVYAKKGFFHGAQSQNSKNELPWWRFEYFPRMI